MPQENYLMMYRTVFAIPFFVCTGQWSKLFSITLPILVIHPKGCDEATPIFSLQVFVGKWVNIFAWFLLHRTVDDPHQLWKIFLAYQITWRVWLGHALFSLIIVGARKLLIFSWFFLHRIDNDPTNIWNFVLKKHLNLF